MPTYEYQCDDCKHCFEELQSITAAPLSICPECTGSIRRLISAGSGLIFKGSGFYITDYKKSDQGDSSKNNDAKKTENKSKTKGGKSTEKPESPSKSKD